MTTIGIVLCVMVLWGLAIGLLGGALVNPWLIGAIGFGLAAMIFPLFLRWVAGENAGGTGRRILRISIYFLLVVPTAISAIMGLNLAGGGEPVTVRAEIASKLTKKVNDYRRVGRNRRVYTGSHNDYYLRLRLPDGREIDRRVNAGVYAATRSGGSATVRYHRGLFGIDVIDSVGVSVKQRGPGKKHVRREIRRVPKRQADDAGQSRGVSEQ